MEGTPEIFPELRYEDRCPECHEHMVLKTRIREGTDDILEWLKFCPKCHGTWIVLVEVLPGNAKWRSCQ